MAAPRPRSVTLACLYAGLGAAFLFVSLATSLSDWGSIQMQDALAEALDTPPFTQFDLSVQGVLDALRWMVWAGVVASIAGMVFAVFAFRGDRGSRIGLTVLCGLTALVFLGFGLLGLLPAMIAVACIALLWSADARRFYAGEEQPLELGAAPAVRPQRPVAPGTEVAQRPVAGPPPHARPYDPQRRPASVTLSLLLAGIGGLLVAVFGVIALAAVTLGRGEYERTLEEQGVMQDVLRSSGISVDVAIAIVAWTAVLWLVLAVIGVGVALWAASRRSASSRRALFAMTIVTLVVSVVFFPLGIPWTAAAVVVIIQLSRADAKAWFGVT